MATTNYVWDPEIDAYLMETDETDATTVTYTVEPTHYGRVVSQRTGGSTHTLHFDALGSTREITDESESVVGTNLFDAWGVGRASSGTVKTSLEWIGEKGYYREQRSGGFYARARSYSASIGRWIASEPLPVYVTVPRYSYSDNRPVSVSDPSGLLPPRIGRGPMWNELDELRDLLRNYRPSQPSTGTSGSTVITRAGMCIRVCGAPAIVLGNPTQLGDAERRPQPQRRRVPLPKPWGDEDRTCRELFVACVKVIDNSLTTCKWQYQKCAELEETECQEFECGVSPPPGQQQDGRAVCRRGTCPPKCSCWKLFYNEGTDEEFAECVCVAMNPREMKRPPGRR